MPTLGKLGDFSDTSILYFKVFLEYYSETTTLIYKYNLIRCRNLRGCIQLTRNRTK